MKLELNLNSVKELFKNKTAQIALALLTLVFVIGAATYLSYSDNNDELVAENAEITEVSLEKETKDKLDLDMIKGKNVEDLSRFKSRDIFQALTSATSSLGVTPVTTAPSVTPGLLSPTSPYEYEGKTGTINNPVATNPASSGGTSTPVAQPVSGNTVSWMRLESLSDTLAIVKFDKQGNSSDVKVYELKPGEKFEENYMLVALGENSAVIWKGDERIELKLGEAYYIQ